MSRVAVVLSECGVYAEREIITAPACVLVGNISAAYAGFTECIGKVCVLA